MDQGLVSAAPGAAQVLEACPSGGIALASCRSTSMPPGVAAPVRGDSCGKTERDFRFAWFRTAGDIRGAVLEGAGPSEIAEMLASSDLSRAELDDLHFVLATDALYGIAYECYNSRGVLDGPSVHLAAPSSEPRHVNSVISYGYYNNGVLTNGFEEKIYSNRIEYYGRDGGFVGYNTTINDTHHEHFRALEEGLLGEDVYANLLRAAPVSVLAGKPADKFLCLLDFEPDESVWLVFNLSTKTIMHEGGRGDVEWHAGRPYTAYRSMRLGEELSSYDHCQEWDNSRLVARLDRKYAWYRLVGGDNGTWEIGGSDDLGTFFRWVEGGRAVPVGDVQLPQYFPRTEVYIRSTTMAPR